MSSFVCGHGRQGSVMDCPSWVKLSIIMPFMLGSLRASSATLRWFSGFLHELPWLASIISGILSSWERV